MGMFISASAFLGKDADQIATAIRDAALEMGVSVDRIEKQSEGFDVTRDVFIYPPSPWVVVLWPDFFNTKDVLFCSKLSARLRCVVSSVHVYDGSYWTHVLIENGTVIDRFASIPDYFPEQEAIHKKLLEEYRGNSEAVALATNSKRILLEPYFKHLDKDSEESYGKVSDDDEFDLEDIWIFTDFWKKMRIEYPENVASYALKLRFQSGFITKLPSEGPGTL